MRQLIAITFFSLVMIACTNHTSPTAMDKGPGITASVDDFHLLIGDNWAGSLSYLNYGSDERSSIPVQLAVSLVNDNTLQYAIKYPGESHHNQKERLKITRNGTELGGYRITAREQKNGALILTTQGAGRDDRRAAEIQTVYTLAPNKFSIRKNVRFDDDGPFLNRNEYLLTR